MKSKTQQKIDLYEHLKIEVLRRVIPFSDKGAFWGPLKLSSEIEFYMAGFDPPWNPGPYGTGPTRIITNAVLELIIIYVIEEILVSKGFLFQQLTPEIKQLLENLKKCFSEEEIKIITEIIKNPKKKYKELPNPFYILSKKAEVEGLIFDIKLEGANPKENNLDLGLSLVHYLGSGRGYLTQEEINRLGYYKNGKVISGRLGDILRGETEVGGLFKKVLEERTKKLEKIIKDMFIIPGYKHRKDIILGVYNV